MNKAIVLSICGRNNGSLVQSTAKGLPIPDKQYTISLTFSNEDRINIKLWKDISLHSLIPRTPEKYLNNFFMITQKAQQKCVALSTVSTARL